MNAAASAVTPPSAQPAPAGALLRLRGITKRFGEVVANDAVSLELRAGEVLALLGENGAGKSTLVSILFGHYVADAGSIEVDGRPLPPGQPKAALAAGIGMVHQHFTLADNLSVLDNVMLGTEPLWQPFSRRREARARLLDAAQRFGLQVNPDARIAELSVGERQRVEILKALTRGARLLILDEPTAVLTPQESRALFATLKKMVAQGMAILFISHKLDEVRAVSDRIAVLRAGQLVASFDPAAADPAALAQAMVGRKVDSVERGAERAAAAGQPCRVCAARRECGAQWRAAAAVAAEPRGAWRRGAGDCRRGRQRATHAGRPAVGAACRRKAARSRWPAARWRPIRARSCAPASRAFPKTARTSAPSATSRCGRTRCSSVMRAGASPAGA